MSYALKGSTSKADVARLIKNVVVALGMHEAHEPCVYDYPTDGKGGVGFTYVQPITESFVIADVWDDHEGLYLIVASCVPFQTPILKALVTRDYAEADHYQECLILGD